MQNQHTKNIFVSLLLLAVGMVYAQNPTTQLYIADGATFFVAENSTVHIQNGWTEVGNAKISVSTSLTDFTPPQQTLESSLKQIKKASKNQKELVVKQETSEEKKPTNKTQIATLPFGNFPFGATNAVLVRQAATPSTSVHQNHKKTNLKKTTQTTASLFAVFATNTIVPPTETKTSNRFGEQYIIVNSQFTIHHSTRPPPSA